MKYFCLILFLCLKVFAQEPSLPEIPEGENLLLPPVIENINKSAPKTPTNQPKIEPEKPEEKFVEDAAKEPEFRPKTSGLVEKGLLDKIIGKSNEVVKNIFKKPVQPIQPVKRTVNTDRQSISDQYPDPFFDSVKFPQNRATLPLWLVQPNDFLDNQHVPTINSEQDYILYYNMFRYTKISFMFDELVKIVEVAPSVNVMDENGNTPLMYAVRYGNFPAIKLLLNYEADPNICNKAGICPVHIVSFNGSKETLQLLLKNKVDLTKKDSNDLDAIVYAIYGGNMPVFKFLLKREPFKSLSKEDFAVLQNVAFDSENVEIYKVLKDLSGN